MTLPSLKDTSRRDGDAVSVNAEISDGVLRPAERAFAVDNPVITEELPEPGRERLRVSQELQLAVKTELALPCSLRCSSRWTLAGSHRRMSLPERVGLEGHGANLQVHGEAVSFRGLPSFEKTLWMPLTALCREP